MFTAEPIPLFKVFMPESVMPALRDTLFSGFIGEGPKVKSFEQALALWIGGDSVVTLNSGTSALHLALRLAGVGSGDEVVSTPITCVATNMPIRALGARVVWADVDPWTGNISVADVSRKISKRCKAIITVHWGGYPSDLAELGALAQAHGIPLIEDACHALGAEYQGRRIGSHSDFVCFSFQAVKHLTTGDGGALVCRSPEADARARRLRWFGMDREIEAGEPRLRQDVAEYGYKFHMNDVAATIGCEQLRYLDENLAKHRANAARLDAVLRDCKAVRPMRAAPDRRSACWIYTVRASAREAFVAHMCNAGIAVSRVHLRNDRYTVFAESRTSLPGVDVFEAEQVNLPCGWWLSNDDIEHICAALRDFERGPR